MTTVRAGQNVENGHVNVDLDGLVFAVDVRGPDDGPPVVLLHGWPDRARLWDAQVAALSGAGYRTIAPDLRGFGDSARPKAVDQYRLITVADDVRGILDHLGVRRAHFVGHDWGSALAWVIASVVPDRVDHLAVLSGGHPSAFRAAGFEQQRLSWYMLLFQFEGIAEQWLSMDEWANLRHFAAGHRRLHEVIADLSRPGALTASLNWYRANASPAYLVAPARSLPPIAAPTMGVWSSGDSYLTETQMKDSAAHVRGGFRYERVDGASHWMQLDAPDNVNRLLLAFLPTP